MYVIARDIDLSLKSSTQPRDVRSIFHTVDNKQHYIKRDYMGALWDVYKD